MNVLAHTARAQRVVLATRRSQLALWQAERVRARLAELHPGIVFELLPLSTEGDRRLAVPLARIGGKGLFVKELEEALAAGRADLAVHSVKDVPAELPPGFVLAAVAEREDPRDAFVCPRHPSLAALPAGARVGTSSLRRACQLRARHPQLAVEPLRGNVPTRLRKLDSGACDALVLAAAGMKRLGLEGRITALLEPEESLPAPGQGAIGVECRAERRDLLELLAPLNDAHAAVCVAAERALSRALAGSCNVPLGAFATLAAGRIELSAFVGTPDGSRLVRGRASGPAGAPEALGRRLAEELKGRGAEAILAALEKEGVAGAAPPQDG